MTTPNIATFDTRDEALAIVKALDSATYYLAHGEYARPDYTVRKVRGENRYYIHAKFHYYAGTFGASQSGGLEWGSNELFTR